MKTSLWIRSESDLALFELKFALKRAQTIHSFIFVISLRLEWACFQLDTSERKLQYHSFSTESHSFSDWQNRVVRWWAYFTLNLSETRRTFDGAIWHVTRYDVFPASGTIFFFISSPAADMDSVKTVRHWLLELEFGEEIIQIFESKYIL